MKILIVTHYFLPHVGGIEMVAYNQAKKLIKRGHEVTIVSSKIGPESERELIEGIKIIRVKAWNWFERKWGVPYPIFSLKIFKVIKNEVEKADIVHVHDIWYLSSFVAAIYSRKEKPLILMQHVGLVETKKKIVNIIQKIVYPTYGTYVLNTSKKAIVCNPEAGKILKNKSKAVFIKNAVDIKLFKPNNNKKSLRIKYDLPLDKKIILFVGRFVEKKGFDKLFAARDKDYFILFVGNGIIPQDMKKNKDVRFIKDMPQSKLKDIYQLSDIFCLPSNNEGFPLTILEAMASGLPVIAGKNKGYEEYIERGDVKLINPTKEEIKRAIVEIINNPRLINKMSKYSRNKAIKDFSWENNNKQLLKVYKEVLNANKQ